jgi:nucleoid DNA-binding protein
MKIEVYIQELLYRHDCVIVPGFGAFLTRYRSAFLDSNSGTLFPPAKILGFNIRLSHNDGLLAHHIAKQENISYDKSIGLIAKNVSNWQLELDQNRFLSLSNLGDFKRKEDGILVFESATQINYMTESFGLSPVVARLLDEKVEPQESKVIPIHQSSKKTPYWRYAAVALFAVSIGGYLGGTYYKNQVEQYNLAEKQKAETRLQQRIQQATFVIDAPLEAVTVSVTNTTYPYHIVAGAFRVAENAEKKAAELIGKGYQARLIGENKYGLHQVAYKSFADRNEAINFLHQIQKNEFPEAWLLSEDL